MANTASTCTSATAPPMSEYGAMDELWELKFGIEVSILYHDWRRATFETTLRFVRGVTLVGAIFTLVTGVTLAFDSFHWGNAAAWGSVISSIIVACVNLIDLVANLDGRALHHDELARRFKALLQRMTRHREVWESHLADWTADAQEIRADEPPTLWAVYAMCWNQNIGKHRVPPMGYRRPVSWWQSLLRNFVQFRPQDFPAT
jgi:hypothetical protein